ncbi:zinc finger protein 836 [Thunnus albacares]|uniref:zinc finger protein 836 n=1 Tax=Thunnus maccoyii TaxID=8240 RepID=UPI001C4D0B64|nr:zinc finger protein 836 [Thunnus maccoyii]XP_042279360.1 zinc finger protein 836 [Thunnus maccoyii]XP_044214612.1 zinc finger protein 836 [Thunnus albacares]XP_044214613.1 zinc finger protein 836 [Thunnus albacares]
MMLGFQGNTSSSKVYRCVACSATFTGLASLLVHQATHASALSKVPGPPQTQRSISPHDTLYASKDLSSENPSPPTLLPESPSPSFYICDCGEEFQDFSLMLEHKHSHVSQIQLLQPLDNLSSGTGCEEMFPTQHVQFSTTITKPGLVLSCPSTSRSPAVELPTSADHKADVSLEDGIAIVTTPQGQCTPPQDGREKQLEKIAAAEQIPEIVKDMHFQDKTNSILSSKKGENLPQNNSLMKLLASAYMKRFPLPQSQNQNNNTVTPKQEVVPVDITPGKKTEVSPINDLSIAQLRRLLAKPGIKTKAPSISRILESSKKRIVSLTKTFSPVVVLETRQKLMDASSNGTYGRYQCGRCRRVFQNMDRLTEHHFLHKKERIKCCRRCKQLIIGRLPFPDNHVCPQLGNKAIQPSRSLKNKLPFAQKIVPFHSLNNTKKVFFCPLCKHSYARRYNLKMHKCQGPGSALTRQANPSIEKMLALRSNSKAKIDAEIKDEFQNAKSVAVGTEVTGRIKVEVTSPNSEQSAVSQLAWTHSAKSFPPFYPKSSMMEQHKDASLCGTSLQQGEENNSWNAAAIDNEDSNEGQWTMPLDDEMEVLSSAEKAGNDTGVKKPMSAETAPTSLRYFVREGVKRYPCNRCQKTYSRVSTLRRHLRLCGFRPRGPGTATQSGSQGAIPQNANNMRPMFACFVCGKSFNRKDNMMVHRKKCQLHQTMIDVDRGTVQQSMSGNVTDSQTQEDDGGNWGIMSLPSVLPRRVTCECGVGFTSPRLLLEHLQKHAQESYTCPTCGETVNSWADYEVHLQIHMHPHHQLLKGLQPQRSQPLLLRFQQQPPQQQPSQSVLQPPQKQPCPEPLSNPGKKQQRIVCTRCGNTFATRCSLRRHISLNRCKGGRVTNLSTNPPKTYHCSHCNSDFPNTISLMFHQRSGACKPAIKPVRCPVCLRWFGTVDGLQKHLLTHKQSESYRCDVCQGTYPNLKSLKNHRRRIHRIMAGDTKPKTQKQLTS